MDKPNTIPDIPDTQLAGNFWKIVDRLSTAEQATVSSYLGALLETAVTNTRVHTFADQYGNPPKDGRFEFGRD